MMSLTAVHVKSIVVRTFRPVIKYHLKISQRRNVESFEGGEIHGIELRLESSPLKSLSSVIVSKSFPIVLQLLSIALLFKEGD
jgi:hypothetical protein